jgi:hypothetical protein
MALPSLNRANSLIRNEMLNNQSFIFLEIIELLNIPTS